MQPFLKWAGGKRWLIPKIKDSIPPFKTYFEPFLGSATLFFALEPKSAILSDTNPELIGCYRAIKNHCEAVIKILKRLKITKSNYYTIREKFNSGNDPIKKAAYFIYLNKTCWNGLYRVNNLGKFNVPIGTHLQREYRVFDVDHLRATSRLLKRAIIKRCDFEEAAKDSKSKDLTYFDPPYITTHLKNGFIKYNSVLFHQSDELRLAKVAEKLAKRGVQVILSNAAHPLIKQQYNGCFYKTEILRPSLIAGDPTKRTKFLELLVTSFPLTIETGEYSERQDEAISKDVRYKPFYNPKCRF